MFLKGMAVVSFVKKLTTQMIETNSGVYELHKIIRVVSHVEDCLTEFLSKANSALWLKQTGKIVKRHQINSISGLNYGRLLKAEFSQL